MSNAQTSLAPFTALVDRLERKADADSQAVDDLRKDLAALKTQLEGQKFEAAEQRKATEQLREEHKAAQAVIKNQAKQIDKLGDSSLSHQAQLDHLVADHRRQRDSSPEGSTYMDSDGNIKKRRRLNQSTNIVSLTLFTAATDLAGPRQG